MLENVALAPPDPILGLTEAFKKDPNPQKINLGVGVYQDANGNTQKLHCVARAEKKVIESNQAGYLPITGAPAFGNLVQKMLFGAQSEYANNGQAQTAHTPGGTGALRVAGDFIKKVFPGKTIWMSNPTWANHPGIFAAAGVPTKEYAYFDAGRQCLDLDGLLADFEKIPAGDVVLLHVCCQNPCGMDPTPAQWKRIADAVFERGLFPLFDFAYQGFADGLEEDAVGLREFLRPEGEMLICSSFSKNFGLYRQRTGALTVVGKSADAVERAISQIKTCIRANYSNPPAHGGLIVSTILQDAELTAEWQVELTAMRERINQMRLLFVETLKAQGVQRDFSFITRQKGMFSFSGLTPEQVKALKEKYAIYMVGSGRINVAGMTEGNMGRLCAAIASVL